MKKIVLLAGLLGMGMVSLSAQSRDSHNFEISKNLEIFNDIYKQLDLFYVDSLSADTVIERGIDAMLRQVDPFTEYYPEEGLDALKEMTTGKYAGVGAIIRYYKKEDYVMIVEPLEDSPARDAGVKAGDLIVAIDGEDMKGKNTQEVSNHLRGDAGSVFELTVKRAGVEEPLVLKVTRRNIAMPPVPYYGMVTDSVGYIYFERFVDGCSRDVRRAVVELKEKGAKSLVLDLRSNGGGLLREAVEVANLFVPRGKKVVYTKGKLASVNAEYYTEKEPLDLEALRPTQNSTSERPEERGYATFINASTVILTREDISAYTVTFNVVDEQGQPVADATLTFDGKVLAPGEYVLADVPDGTYPYSVEATDGRTAEGEVEVAGSDVTETVVLEGVDSENRKIAKMIQILPNPNNGQFRVCNVADAKELCIYDIYGKLVFKRRNIKSDEVEVDLGTQRSGLYLLVVDGKTFKVTKR